VSAFVVVRHFAKRYVCNGDIEAVLQRHSISTLDDLDLPQSAHLIPLLREGTYCHGFSMAVSMAQRRKKPVEQTAEQALRGLVEFNEESELVMDSYRFYTRGAVTAKPDHVQNPKFNFTLVFGPSGSGKTLFCMRRLYELVFPAATYEAEVVRIRVLASDVVDEMEIGNISFPDAVAVKVQEPIEQKLSDERASNAKMVPLYLHVIVDEAGRDSYKHYFDTAAKIEDIVTALREKMPFQFDKGVHVTVTGVGLQASTAEIDSLAETTKFYMQPWALENFDALVQASEHPDEVQVKEIIRRYPIFQALLTNGRGSYFLYNWVQNMLSKNRYSFDGCVNLIVSKVAEACICSTALFDMARLRSMKWEVASAVYKELDRATSQPHVAFLPQYDGLHGERHRFLAHCLLDVHVESRNGELQLETGRVYSVSIQPALSIALAAVLHCDMFEITTDWQSFESTVMRAELKHMTAHLTDLPSFREKTLIETKTSVPGASTDDKPFTLPRVNRFTVLRNHSKSSMADVIAPFRLVRAMQSEDVSKTVPLDLADELNRMGLTKNTQFQLQQAATSAFYIMWERIEAVPQSLEALVNVSIVKPQSPLVASLAMATSGVGMLTETQQKNMTVVPLLDFDASRPVTAVFFTKGKACILTRLNESESFIVNEHDVDWEGKLKEKELPDDVLLNLRANVEIRFLFV
jgi:hypothetical protein